jgi:hypothetical protein
MAGYTGPYKGAFKYGASGKDCSAVKRCLKRIQPNDKIKISKKFGGAAVEALKRFQKANGLKADGVYGPRTHRKLAPKMRGYEIWLYKRMPYRQSVRSTWVVMAPYADRRGKATNQATKDFVSKVAKEFGSPLVITCGTNHNQYVKGTNRESQHWQGNAADIAMWRSWTCRGGVYNVGGKNILFNTTVGGNHYNHLHTGI